MKILFWGTPVYARASLDALVAAGHELVGVVSQPDRRRGRGSTLMASPVKARALDLGLPVFTPSRIRRDLDCQRQLAELGAELSVVVAFGQLLPAEALEQPPLGCWNGHGSLLPRWRGAAPIQWALMAGDPHTGVGIMAMEEGLDTGPVLLERSVAIGLRENAEQLASRLAHLTADLLLEALPRIEAAGPGERQERLRRLGVRPQPEEGMTYARLLTRDDFSIDWTLSALAIHRRVMGLYPGALTRWSGQRLKLLSTEPLVGALAGLLSPEAAALIGTVSGARAGQAGAEQAGTVMALANGLGLVVAAGGEPLLIREAQLEGRSAAAGTSLLQQLGARVGDQLG